MTSNGGRMPQRRQRALRGAAAAFVAVLFASTAHTLSGGDAPPWWLILAVSTLATPPCVALAGRAGARGGLPRLAAAVLAAQVALHAAFAAVGSAAPTSLATPAVPPTGHHHDLALFTAAAVDPAAATMTAGHVLAAIVTFGVLAWGERLLGALARGIRRLLPRTPVAPPHPDAAPAVFIGRHVPRAAALVHSVGRRGPPARLAPSFAV